jgi:hypothetical protein
MNNETPEELPANADPASDHVVVNVSAIPPRPTRLSAMLAVSALLGMGGGYSFGGPYRERSQPEEKPCLNCGKMKQHNNSFCSQKTWRRSTERLN